MSRNSTFLLCLTLLGAMVFLVSGCKKEEQVEPAPVIRPVKTMVVGGFAGERRTFPGTVQAAQRVELSFRVGGPLIALPVNEGEIVRKGQVVARIDPRDYQIALDKAKAEFTKADSDLKRYQLLYEKESVPLADLELRQAQRDVAKAQLDDAQANLQDTYLRAPFSGEIGEKYVDNRETVSPQQKILSLHDVSGVEIVVNLPESGRAKFDPTMKARISARFDFAPDREFPLTLKELAASADPRTQTYRATLSMEQPEGVNIQPGMTAQVYGEVSGEDIPADQQPEFSVIPANAVFSADDGTQCVWIVDSDMTIHRRKVKVGEVTGDSSIKILEGIQSGERIAVAAVNQLQEGQKIRLLEE